MTDLSGARILMTGFNGSIGGAIKATIEKYRGTVVGLSHIEDERAAAVVDFSDDDALAGAIEGLEGPFSGVVVSHGIIEAGDPEKVTMALWRRMLDVNLTSSYNVIRSALPKLGPDASIVVISSTAGLRMSRVSGVHYTVSKWAVNGMVRHLASELGPRGIRVNAVCPGHMDNDMMRSVNTPESIAAGIKSIPLGRPGQPEDIAEPAVFLLTPEASYISGALIPVAGALQ